MQVNISLSGRPILRVLKDLYTICWAVGDAAPESILRWLARARPALITDGTLQKIYGIVDAALSVLNAPYRALDMEGFDYRARVREIADLCKAAIKDHKRDEKERNE